MTMVAASLPLLFAFTLPAGVLCAEVNQYRTDMPEQIRHAENLKTPHNTVTERLRHTDCSVTPRPVVRKLIYTPLHNPLPIVLF